MSLAAGQDGVFSLRQALALGATRKQIEHRVRAGFLTGLLRGVYAIAGQPVSRRGLIRAAALWAPTSSVSHATSAELHRLREYAPRNTSIHLTAKATVRPRNGIHPHRRTLPPDELTTVEGIPATTVARTLLDLAATEGETSFRRALREAHFHRLGRPQHDLAALLGRHPRAPDRTTARRVLTRSTWALRGGASAPTSPGPGLA